METVIEETNLLKRYNFAIASLHGNLNLNGRGAIGTTLITCTVFIALECLRGYYRSAVEHLRHGRRLLEELSRNDSHDPVNAQLREVILRLCVRAGILIEDCLFTILPRKDTDHRLIFGSMSEARSSLDEHLGLYS